MKLLKTLYFSKFKITIEISVYLCYYTVVRNDTLMLDVLLQKITLKYADMAQEAEHVLGKDEVTGSNPVISSKKPLRQAVLHGHPSGLFFIYSRFDVY